VSGDRCSAKREARVKCSRKWAVVLGLPRFSPLVPLLKLKAKSCTRTLDRFGR
jgi:hypothetical protein